MKVDLSGDAYIITEEVLKKVNDLDISILFFNAGYGVTEVFSLLIFFM
jgi:hypothetical protein